MNTALSKIGGGFSIAPANMDELYRYCQLIADSDLAPKDYKSKPGNVMVAITMGGELGLSPMQSIQNIAVINGRPSLWGDALLAVCLRHLDSFDESDDGATAICVAKRGNRTVRTTFSTEDAKRAGLANKQGPWTQYPARMRQMRARGFCLRDICADVLRGISSAEEAQDVPKEVRAEVVSSRPAEDPPKALESAPKQDRKSEPPPAAATFAKTFPNTKWSEKTLAACDDLEILKDYKVWLEHQLADNRKRAKAAAALEVLGEEFARRIELEANAAQPDPIADGMQKVIDERESEPGGEYDTKEEGWGLTAS